MFSISRTFGHFTLKSGLFQISEDCRRFPKTNEEVRPLPKTSEIPSKHLTVLSLKTVNIKKLGNLTVNTKNYGQITLNTFLSTSLSAPLHAFYSGRRLTSEECSISCLRIQHTSHGRVVPAVVQRKMKRKSRVSYPTHICVF